MVFRRARWMLLGAVVALSPACRRVDAQLVEGLQRQQVLRDQHVSRELAALRTTQELLRSDAEGLRVYAEQNELSAEHLPRVLGGLEDVDRRIRNAEAGAVETSHAVLAQNLKLTPKTFDALAQRSKDGSKAFDEAALRIRSEQALLANLMVVQQESFHAQRTLNLPPNAESRRSR